MSGKFLTDTDLSLLEFSRHGGGTGPHTEEWGPPSAMERDFQIIEESEGAYDSD